MLQSDGFSQWITANGDYWGAVQGGVLDLWDGPAPSTANLAATGSLLGTLTENGGAQTFETQAQWSITLSGTTSGSVNGITLGLAPLLPAPVTYAVSFSNTASLAAAGINASHNFFGVTAIAVGAVIYLYAPHGSGTAYNNMICAATATTLTATVASAGAASTAGVAAVNGLLFLYPPVVNPNVGSVITGGGGTWETSAALKSSTIGYARLRLDAADNNGTSSTYRRIQFTTSTSGADIIFPILTTVIGLPIIINSQALTVNN
jgi:hypothetical protein